MSLRPERYSQLMAAAAAYYQHQLQRHEKARTYLREDRGLDERTVRRYGLGFAPAGVRPFQRALRASDEELIEAGLAKRYADSDNLRLVFRERVTFPIRLTPSRVVGFGARVLPDAPPGAPKYLNSPNTEHFSKHDLLYGLDELPTHRPVRQVLLVEGYLDRISLSAAGLEGALAGLGTALTVEQAARVAACACEPDRPVYFLYDGDKAGQKAMVDAAERLLEAGVRDTQLRMGSLPAGEDPDSWVRACTQEHAHAWLEEQPTLAPWLLGQIDGLPPARSLEARVRYGERVVRWAERLHRGPDRVAVLNRLAGYLEVAPDRLVEWYGANHRLAPGSAGAGPRP